ncbi:hypothetical protein PLESTB_000131000 [Pleodorina starrii]|uniref:Malonyl-CoA:ACP transacylase (MAT) domain-containing protein n=1 Tax=Pleodorina starrii TaxID=330485 RepID=A0A9W6EXA8_9CHLO|nr:hypothetical protein PLESTB_000131000 [Pleodorina starrii]
MPRDMTGTGRYPPQPRHNAFAFYSAVRMGDPELLARIIQVDPYFVTQDNGAGAPIHFAVTYRQLDMVHHLLNLGASVNQRDPKGFTPLHRAAHLAHLDGYLEMYEYLLSRGADPSIESEDYDPYLEPGPKRPQQVAADDPRVRAALQALEDEYASVPKAPRAHPDLGDWWALYDYGPDVVGAWPYDYVHPYPEEIARRRAKAEKRAAREARREKREAFLADLEAGGDGREALAAYGSPAAAPAPAPAPSPAPTAAPAAAAVAAPSPTSPAGRIAFLFPGQGSQAVGMLSTAASLPAVAAMLDKAREILGYDLLEICTKGPQSALDDTQVAQPALFVAGLAAVELLRQRDPRVVESCGACAGLSLGEYTALVFAGAMSFEEGLRVVKARGEAMAAAAAAPPGSGIRPHGMLSVVGLPDEKLAAMAAETEAAGPPGSVCRLANYLFPQGRVVSGHTDLLDQLKAKATAAGAIKATMLQVSGAFHTSLMEPAREELLQALSQVTFRAPRIPVYSNVTAAPFPTTDPRDIPALLGRQLVEPVRWEPTLAKLLAPPPPAPAPAAGTAGGTTGGTAGSQEPMMLYELGPGQQIKAMVKRMSLDAWKRFGNVQP